MAAALRPVGYINQNIVLNLTPVPSPGGEGGLPRPNRKPQIITNL